MNGAKEGDKEGEMTFTGGRGETVIDYVIGDRGAWEKIKKLEVGKEVDSDHQSVTVWVEGRRRRERREEGEEWIERIDWSEEARREFEERTEGIEVGKIGVEEEMDRLVRRVKEEMKV